MIKKIFLNLLLIAVIVYPATALAISDAQKQVLGSGIYYFNTDGNTSCSAVSSETGTGPLLGVNFPDVANPSDLVSRIDKFISDTQPASPFAGLGNEFVAAGQKYDVNPAMVVGIANKEESLGTTHEPANVDNHNSFGATGVSGFQTVDGYASFPSFESSIDPITLYIANTYVHADPNSPHYATSVLDLMKNGYTPGSNYATAAAVTIAVMHKILDGITETGTTGATTSTDPGSFTPGSTTDSQCQSSINYQTGANGYDLNNMAHFYQCDSQWATKPYGSKYAGDPAETICQSGCGITSLAMVLGTLAGATDTPLTLADKYGNQYHNGGGTDWGLWLVAAKDYGLQESDLGTDLNQAASIVRQGGLVIISVDAGYFTSGSHLMVIRAVDDQGNFYLADPNGPNNPRQDENKPFTADFLRSQGNMLHLFGFTK